MNDNDSNNTGTGDPKELARDAEVRRERIGDTLDQLEGRLSPDRMMDNAVGLFKEHGGDIADGLQRSVKNNPLPLILTGVGIAWMMMNQRDGQQGYDRSYGQYPAFRQPNYDTRYVSSDTSSDSGTGGGMKQKLADASGSIGETRDRLADGMGSARGGVQDRLDSMRQSGADMSDQARRQMANYRDTAGQKADQWSNDAARFMQEQPLVAGALGMAFGALLGGLLPTSESERRLAKQAVESESGQQALRKAESAVEDAQREASKKLDEAAEVAEQKTREAERNASSGA